MHGNDASAVARGSQQQVEAERADHRQRPPEVDAAREGELQVAAKCALLKETHREKGHAPQRRKAEDRHSREPHRAKAQPATHGQRSHQRRERHESCRKAAEKVNRRPGTGQVVVEDVCGVQ